MDERRWRKRVRRVVREVRVRNREERWDSSDEVVVKGDRRDCIVDRREDDDWVVVVEGVNVVREVRWVKVGNVVIDMKEVGIRVEDKVDRERVDRVREVEE